MDSPAKNAPTPDEIDKAVSVLMSVPGKAIPAKLLLNILNSKLPKSEVYSAFPVTDELGWHYYCLQEAADWSAKDLEWKDDRKQFPSLPARYQKLFLQLFGIFSPLDGAVSAQILRLLCEAPTYQSMMFMVMQMKIELTHSEAYGQAALSVPVSEDQKREVFEFVNKQVCVARKIAFVEKYLDSDDSRALRSVAAACSEGIFFVSLFTLIFYFRDKGILKTFVLMNSYVLKDESLHRDFYANLARRSLTRDEHIKAREIIMEAVEIEIQMLNFLLSEPIDSVEADAAQGITIPNLSNFVRQLGDQIADTVGIPQIYGVSFTPSWCKDMGLDQKNNFYEAREGNYKKFDPASGMDWKSRAGLGGEKVITNAAASAADIDF